MRGVPRGAEGAQRAFLPCASACVSEARPLALRLHLTRRHPATSRWLIKEAKQRNPAIKTYGLSWGTPAWVGNQTYYSDDNIAYQTAWVDCIYKEAGTKIVRGVVVLPY